MGMGITEIVAMIVYPVVGFYILYMVIKLAVKHAITELKREGKM